MASSNRRRSIDDLIVALSSDFLASGWLDRGASENAGAVRRLVDEAVNADRVDLLGEFVHPDMAVHPGTVGAAPATAGVGELTTAFRRFHSAFLDLHIVLDDVVAQGDRVAARWTATGTHSAEFAGLAATGRAARWGGIDLYRLVDRTVAVWWRNDDFVWLLKQLGGTRPTDQ